MLLSHVTAGAWLYHTTRLLAPQLPSQRLISALGVATQRWMGVVEPSTVRLTSSSQIRPARWVGLCVPFSRVYSRPSTSAPSHLERIARPLCRKEPEPSAPTRTKSIASAPHGATGTECKPGLTGLEGKIVAAPLQPAELGLDAGAGGQTKKGEQKSEQKTEECNQQLACLPPGRMEGFPSRAAMASYQRRARRFLEASLCPPLARRLDDQRRPEKHRDGVVGKPKRVPRCSLVARTPQLQLLASGEAVGISRSVSSSKVGGGVQCLQWRAHARSIYDKPPALRPCSASSAA